MKITMLRGLALAAVTVAPTMAAVAVAVAPARAADLPARVYTRAPPLLPAPVSYGWTGCYIGANAGVAFGHQNWFDPNPPPAGEGSDSPVGGTGGGQVGCDYQTGNFVIGLQGMVDGLSLRGNHSYIDDPRYTDETRASWFSTVTGRVGYTMWPQTLLYVKGGGAWIGDRFTESCSPLVDTCPGRAKSTRSGWTVGVGGEYMFAPNWSAFVEYNFMDFGRRNETLTYTDATTYNYRIKQDVQTLLFGVNYRFGGGSILGRLF